MIALIGQRWAGITCDCVVQILKDSKALSCVEVLYIVDSHGNRAGTVDKLTFLGAMKLLPNQNKP